MIKWIIILLIVAAAASLLGMPALAGAAAGLLVLSVHAVPGIFIAYGRYTATQLEISLTKALSVLTQAGSFGGSSASIQYKKDY